jgi:hypothetical protein
MMSRIGRHAWFLAASFSVLGLSASCSKGKENSVGVDIAGAVDTISSGSDSPLDKAAASLLNVKIRAPESKDVGFPAPTNEWLTAKPWNVTYSSLPTWKSSRNVRITYKLLPKAEGEGDKLDDLVEYQTLDSDKVKSIQGVDKATADTQGWAWDWRGSGLLALTTSHWEVLGYGSLKSANGQELDWAVTYFAKTLFTPAGIDIYSRSEAKISDALLAEIKKQLKATGNESVVELVDDLFLVKHDQ